MKKKQSNLTILAILTTITIITWIAVEGYQRFYNTQVKLVADKFIAPLSPTLDLDTLSRLEQKVYFSPEESRLFKPSKSLTLPATLSGEPKEEASQEASVSAQTNQP